MEKLKNGKHRVKVYYGNKPISKTFSRVTDARKWKMEQLAIRDRFNAYGIKYNGSITFGEFSSIFMSIKEDRAWNTKAAYRGALDLYLLPTLRGVKLSDLERRHGESLKRELCENKKGLSRDRVNNVLRVLKMVAKEAVENDYLLKSPFHNLRLLSTQKREIAYWQRNEISQFLSRNRDDDYLPLYIIALNTGMRKGELIGLCWDCISFSEKAITVKRKMGRRGLEESTKNKRVRKIPMNKTVFGTLKKLEEQQNLSRFVFTKPCGKPIDYQHVAYRDFKKAVRKANVKEIRFHDLRATYASNYCMEGGDVYALSKILGHSSIKMTEERYAHLHSTYIGRHADVVNFAVDLN